MPYGDISNCEQIQKTVMLGTSYRIITLDVECCGQCSELGHNGHHETQFQMKLEELQEELSRVFASCSVAVRKQQNEAGVKQNSFEVQFKGLLLYSRLNTLTFPKANDISVMVLCIVDKSKAQISNLKRKLRSKSLPKLNSVQFFEEIDLFSILKSNCPTVKLNIKYVSDLINKLCLMQAYSPRFEQRQNKICIGLQQNERNAVIRLKSTQIKKENHLAKILSERKTTGRKEKIIRSEKDRIGRKTSKLKLMTIVTIENIAQQQHSNPVKLTKRNINSPSSLVHKKSNRSSNSDKRDICATNNQVNKKKITRLTKLMDPAGCESQNESFQLLKLSPQSRHESTDQHFPETPQKQKLKLMRQAEGFNLRFNLANLYNDQNFKTTDKQEEFDPSEEQQIDKQTNIVLHRKKKNSEMRKYSFKYRKFAEQLAAEIGDGKSKAETSQQCNSLDGKGDLNNGENFLQVQTMEQRFLDNNSGMQRSQAMQQQDCVAAEDVDTKMAQRKSKFYCENQNQGHGQSFTNEEDHLAKSLSHIGQGQQQTQQQDNEQLKFNAWDSGAIKQLCPQTSVVKFMYHFFAVNEAKLSSIFTSHDPKCIQLGQTSCFYSLRLFHSQRGQFQNIQVYASLETTHDLPHSQHWLIVLYQGVRVMMDNAQPTLGLAMRILTGAPVVILAANQVKKVNKILIESYFKNESRIGVVYATGQTDGTSKMCSIIKIAAESTTTAEVFCCQVEEPFLQRCENYDQFMQEYQNIYILMYDPHFYFEQILISSQNPKQQQLGQISQINFELSQSCGVFIGVSEHQNMQSQTQVTIRKYLTKAPTTHEQQFEDIGQLNKKGNFFFEMQLPSGEYVIKIGAKNNTLGPNCNKTVTLYSSLAIKNLNQKI